MLFILWRFLIGFRYVLLTDTMPDEEVKLAAREAFKYYFYELSDGLILDTFMVVVIDPPLNTSPINVTINEETGCRGDFDPNIFVYKINQIVPIC